MSPNTYPITTLQDLESDTTPTLDGPPPGAALQVPTISAATGTSTPTFYWAGGSGTADAAGNWLTTDSSGFIVPTTAVPGASDIAEINQPGTLLGPLTVTGLGFDFGTQATITGPTSVVTADGEVIIANEASATLTIANDASVVSVAASEPRGYPNIRIGNFGGSVGSVTVASGGVLNAGEGALVVGMAGTGTLVVQGGEVFASNAAYSGVEAALALGVNLTATPSVHGTGVVTVDGAGSRIIANGLIAVGAIGSGTMTISNDGQVWVAGTEPDGKANFVIGNAAGASGTVDVTSGGALNAGTGRLSVGDSGSGTLSVTQGGMVLANASQYTDSEPAFRVGYAAGATGLVTLDGTGSGLSAGGQAVIGNAGDGTLLISNGAGMTAGGTNDGGTGLILDANGGTGDVQVNGGTLLVSDNAQINAAGTLAVTGGGTVGIAGNLTLAPGATLADDAAGIGLVALGSGSTLDNSGTIAADGGTLILQGAVAGSNGLIVVGNDATLQADGTIGAGQFVALDLGSTLQLTAPAFLGTLDISRNETIAVNGLAAADGAQVVDGTALVFDVNLNGTVTPETIALAGFLPSGVAPMTAGSDIILPCYAAGTRIATPDGDIAVEHLRVGDCVLTLGGAAVRARPVRWVGHVTVDLARHPHPERAAPIRIRAHTFADNVPARDLLVSPDHALLYEGALMHAATLLNGRTIVQEFPARITYWHVELDEHSVLLAEGLPAESYLDLGTRATFAGEAGARPLHPDFAAQVRAAQVWHECACAPLILGGPRLRAAQAALLARAKALAAARTGGRSGRAGARPLCASAVPAR